MRGGSRNGMACAFVRFQTQAMAQSAIDAVHGRITLPGSSRAARGGWADAPGSRKRDARARGRRVSGWRRGGGGGARPRRRRASAAAAGRIRTGGRQYDADDERRRLRRRLVRRGGCLIPLAPLNFQQMGGFAAQQGMMGQPGMLGGAQFGAQFGFAGQQGGSHRGAGGFPGAAAGPMPTVGFAPQQQLMALYSIEQAAAMQQQAFWPRCRRSLSDAPPDGRSGGLPAAAAAAAAAAVRAPAHQAQPPVRLPPPLPEASRTGVTYRSRMIHPRMNGSGSVAETR